MILSAVVVVRAAVEALDEYIDLETLGAMPAKDLAAAWKAAGDVCRDADHIYATLRQALTAGIINGSDRDVGEVVTGRDGGGKKR